jgi:hypothetical protein
MKTSITRIFFLMALGLHSEFSNAALCSEICSLTYCSVYTQYNGNFSYTYTLCDGGYQSCIDTTCNTDSTSNNAIKGTITLIGDNTKWQGRLTNYNGKTSTLYVSWTPADKSNKGNVSSPIVDVFKLTLGQRFELKSKEGQNIEFIIDQNTYGTHSAKLYIWWDVTGDLKNAYEYEVEYKNSPTWLPPVLDILLD